MNLVAATLLHSWGSSCGAGLLMLSMVLSLVALNSVASAGAMMSASQPLPAVRVTQNRTRGGLCGGGLAGMESEKISSIIQQASDAWIAGDADAFVSLFEPEGELIVPGNRWVGKEAIRQVAADFAAAHSKVKIDIRQVIAEGERAAVEWTWEDTENETGIRSVADDAIVVDFNQGLIRRWREYIDTKSPQVRA